MAEDAFEQCTLFKSTTTNSRGFGAICEGNDLWWCFTLPQQAHTLCCLRRSDLKEMRTHHYNILFWIYFDVFWNMYSLVAHLVPQSPFDCRTSQMLMVAKWWKPCSLHWWRNAPLESCPLVFFGVMSCEEMSWSWFLDVESKATNEVASNSSTMRVY